MYVGILAFVYILKGSDWILNSRFFWDFFLLKWGLWKYMFVTSAEFYPFDILSSFQGQES